MHDVFHTLQERTQQNFDDFYVLIPNVKSFSSVQCKNKSAPQKSAIIIIRKKNSKLQRTSNVGQVYQKRIQEFEQRVIKRKLLVFSNQRGKASTQIKIKGHFTHCEIVRRLKQALFSKYLNFSFHMFQCVESRGEKVKNLFSLFQYLVTASQVPQDGLFCQYKSYVFWLLQPHGQTVCIQLLPQNTTQTYLPLKVWVPFLLILASLIRSPIVVSLLFSCDDNHS